MVRTVVKHWPSVMIPVDDLRFTARKEQSRTDPAEQVLVTQFRPRGDRAGIRVIVRGMLLTEFKGLRGQGVKPRVCFEAALLQVPSRVGGRGHHELEITHRPELEGECKDDLTAYPHAGIPEGREQEVWTFGHLTLCLVETKRG